MKTRQTSRHNPKQFLPFPQAQFVPFRTRHTPGAIIPRGATCLLRQETTRLVQRSLRNALADMAYRDVATKAAKDGVGLAAPPAEAKSGLMDGYRTAHLSRVRRTKVSISSESSNLPPSVRAWGGNNHAHRPACPRPRTAGKSGQPFGKSCPADRNFYPADRKSGQPSRFFAPPGGGDGLS